MFKEYLKTARPEIIKDGLVLWLQGEDFTNSPNTTTWRNRAGIIANAGACTGFAYTTASGSNTQGGVRFDQSNDVVTCGHDTSFNSNYVTCEVEIYLPALPITTAVLIAKETGTTSTPYVLGITATGGLVFFIAGVAIAYSAVLATQTWLHCVVRTNGTNVTFYVNGVVNGTPIANAATMATNTNNVTIGNNDALSRQFGGVMRCARIYNRGLTVAEILNNYSAEKW